MPPGSVATTSLELGINKIGDIVDIVDIVNVVVQLQEAVGEAAGGVLPF